MSICLWYYVRCVPGGITHTEYDKKHAKDHHIAKDNSICTYLIFMSKRK